MGIFREEVTAEIQSVHLPFNRRLQEIADALSDDDRKDFIDALHDKSVSAYALAKVLNRRGFRVSNSLISVYRRGGLSYEVQ
jgi:hypothetical protein